MSAPVELLDVMRWQKTSDSSAMGSGPAVVCAGWQAARKVARKWMAWGADYYVSIMAHEAPFSDRRALYAQGWDWFCATGGDCETHWNEVSGGALDAPENIAAGSSKSSGIETPGWGSHIRSERLFS